MKNFGWKIIVLIVSFIGIINCGKISNFIYGNMDIDSFKGYFGILGTLIIISIFMTLLLTVDYYNYISEE